MVALIGKRFISPEGQEVLNSLRVKPVEIATVGSPPIEMLARVPSEECGCPEEIWRIDGIILLFHFEDEGPCHAIIDAGDWEMETLIHARSLDHLRAGAFGWLADILNTKEQEQD